MTPDGGGSLAIHRPNSTIPIHITREIRIAMIKYFNRFVMAQGYFSLKNVSR